MADLLLSVGASFLKYMRISSDDVKQGKNGMVLLSATTVVGGRDGADLIIGDPSISGKHMRFVKSLMGNWSIEDLGSKNGTFLIREGGVVKQISGEFEIEKGDKICLASPKQVVFLVRKFM